MSPDELAAAAGIERERLDAIEAGWFNDMLLTLAAGLRVGPSALVRCARGGDHLDPRALSVAFWRRLSELRTEHGLSQEVLARRTDLHTRAISRFERGAREPRLTTILRLAWGLDVKPGALTNDLVIWRTWERAPGRGQDG